MKWWYQHATGQKPHPSHNDLEKVSGDYVALYQWEDQYPPVQPVTTPVASFGIDDDTPSELEIEVVVRHLHRNRPGGHTHLGEEHLHAWLREAYPEKDYTFPPNPNLWLKLVYLIKFM